MQRLKYVLVTFLIVAFSSFSYVACGGGGTTNNNNTNNNTTDGSTTTDGGTNNTETTSDGGTNSNNNVTEQDPPKEEGPKEAGPPITITFDPADGSEIGIQDCIKLTFSRAPSQSKANRTAEMKRDGASTAIAVDFKITDTTGEVCPFSLLRYESKYSLALTIKDPDDKTKEYTASASFSTKKAPAGKPLEEGQAVNLKLKGVKSPVALQSLLGSVSSDQIPPILLTLHSRDQGAKGKLLFVGGLGEAPKGEKPHQGKDVVDTGTPVSLALEGDFEGPTFYVGPTNFILSIAGFNLQLEDLRLTGTFTADGKSIQEAILEGVIDPELIKQQFGLDACATLLRDDCFKNAEGKDRVRIVGVVEGIANPLDFSTFITSPLYLQEGVDTAGEMTVYSNGVFKKEDVTAKFSTCSGSSDETKPCDTSKGAAVTTVTVEVDVTVDASGKKATIKPKAALTAATWYKVDLSVKDENGKQFDTFVMFKTK